MSSSALLIIMSLTTLLLVGSQILLKIAIRASGGSILFSEGIITGIWRLAGQPLFWLAGGLLAASAIFWFFTLSKADFSKAYPLVSLSYVYGLIGSALLLREPVGLWQIVGVVLIVAGAFLVMLR